MAFPILAMGLFFLVDYASASCGTCQSNYVSCEGLNTFLLCIDGVPSKDNLVTCPQGRICTDQSTICIEDFNSSSLASCGRGCDVCDSHDQVFSCLGISTVAFCFGKNEPFYSAVTECPEGYVCDLSSKAVCVKKEYSTGSCQKDFSSSSLMTTTELPTTTSVTTPRSPRDATTFCRDTAMEGTFPADGDDTCTRYYICKAISTGSGYIGYAYKCSGSDYFDPVNKYCQRERPASC